VASSYTRIATRAKPQLGLVLNVCGQWHI